MNRIPDEAEAQIRDQAFALLDLCRTQVGKDPDAAAASAEGLLAATISMAVQSVVFANGQVIAERGADFAALEPEMAGAIYLGLGSGVGHCLGAAGDGNSLLGILDAYTDGMFRTMDARSAVSRTDFLKSKLGPKP